MKRIAVAIAALCLSTFSPAQVQIGKGVQIGAASSSITPSIPVLSTNSSGVGVSATASGVVGLFGGGSCVGYLKNDGTCSATSGATFPSTPAIVKSTSTTGSVPAIASDIIHLFNGGSCIGFLFSDGTCDPAAAPAGATYELQANSGSGFQGTGLFTNIGQSLLTTQLPFTAFKTNSVINSDLNSGVTNTLNCGGCEFLVPFSSPDATSIQNASQFFNVATPFTGHDSRALTHGDFYNNAGLASSSQSSFWGRQTACGWGSFGTFSPNGTYYCDFTIGAKIGGGVNLASGWTTQAAHYMNYTFATRGQAYVHGANIFFYKTGDSIVNETNMHFRSGATDAGGEGNKFDADHQIEDGAPVGLVATGSAGATTIVTNFTTNPNFVTDGAYLVFEDEVIDSGSFTGTVVAASGAVPHLYQTSSTHGVSTWQAVLGTGGCGAPARRDAPVNAICPYTASVTTTPPVVGSVVAVDDPASFELAKVISAPAGGNITLALAYPHGAGTPIMFGGTAGGTINLNNGLADPTTSPSTMTAYPNGGSPDSTHVYVVINYLQDQQGEPFLPLPPRYSNTLNAVTCTAGVVSTDTFSGNFTNSPGLMNPALLGSAAVVVAGNSGTGMNGTVTNVQINFNANTATWNAPGGSCGSSGGTGGTIAIANNWNFTEYKAAEVTAIASGCLDNSGLLRCESTLHLEPNTATQATSERIVQPNHYATVAQMHTDQMQIFTPSIAGSNTYRSAEITGIGMSGEPLFNFTTSNPAGSYIGLNGNINPPTGFDFNLPMSNVINLLYAPSFGSSVINIGCPAANVSGVLTAVCTTSQATTPIVKASGFGGTGTFGWNGYNSTFQFFTPLTVSTLTATSLANFTGGLSSNGVTSTGAASFQLGLSTGSGGTQPFIGPAYTGGNYSIVTMNGTNTGPGYEGFVAGGDNNIYFNTPTGGVYNYAFGGTGSGSMSAATLNWPDITATTMEVTNLTVSGTCSGCGGGGGGGLSGQTVGFLPLAATATTSTSSSHLDDGHTTAGTITSSEPIAGNSTTVASQFSLTFNAGHTLTPGSATTATWGPDASGNALFSEGGGTAARICTATNGICGGSAPSFSAVTPGTNTGALIVGTGGSLGTSGTGTITATAVPATGITGNVANNKLATQTANTVLGALTATTPSGLAMPSCSGGTNALIWTSGTGFGCNTISGGSSVNLSVPRDAYSHWDVANQAHSRNDSMGSSVVLTGATLSYATADPGGFTAQTFTTGTTAATQVGYITSKDVIFSKNSLHAIAGLSSATANMWIGFCTFCDPAVSSTLDPGPTGNAVVGFRHFVGTEATTWTCYASDTANTGTTAASGVSVSTTQQQIFDIIYVAGVPQFYINGTQVCNSLTPAHAVSAGTAIGTMIVAENTTTTSVVLKYNMLYYGQN